MNFQQLRIVRETVRQNFNLTEVAEVLFTSQPGVSKHIKDLEEELGIELFVRKGKRLTGLTEPGKEMIEIVERLLLDARNIKQLSDQFTQKDEGKLVVATTHTQARYVLPQVASMAYSTERDQGLILLNSQHLFPMNTTLIGVRKGLYMRSFAYRFIEFCSIKHNEAVVKIQTRGVKG